MIAPADDGLPGPVPRDDRTSAPAPLSAQPDLRGDYAGFASRFIAFVFDSAISIGIFMLVLSAASYAASVLTGSSIHWNRGDLWVVLAFFGWEFFYYAYFWTASGKTPGMTLLGVQVVGQDGSNVGTRRGLVRTLAFPLSFLLLGLGFAGILLGRDRRALHDSIAGTEVVYAWDARAARLRFLAREGNSRRS
ncbi:MAG TPA: RDD family protein [Streptosporangiaceae bacterium]|nr:RDD family protein [Streptosporangiaceae bacterium]